MFFLCVLFFFFKKALTQILVCKQLGADGAWFMDIYVLWPPYGSHSVPIWTHQEGVSHISYVPPLWPGWSHKPFSNVCVCASVSWHVCVCACVHECVCVHISVHMYQRGTDGTRPVIAKIIKLETPCDSQVRSHSDAFWGFLRLKILWPSAKLDFQMKSVC